MGGDELRSTSAQIEFLLRTGLPGRLGLVADPYHGLAADHDWIFDDGALAGGAAISRPATARLLQRVGPASTVLTPRTVTP